MKALRTLCLLFLLATIPTLSLAVENYPHPEAPRLMNYYLRTDIADGGPNESGLEQLLSKWDLLVLPFQLIDWEPQSLEFMRVLNPDLRILAYIDPVLITDSLGALDTPGTLRYDLVTGVHPEWLAYTETGEVISFWANAEHVNITSVCPEVGGQTFREYFLQFVRDRLGPLIAGGVIDGIFLDEMSAGGYLWWDPLFSGSFDYNNNGLADRDEFDDPELPGDEGDQAVQGWLTESMAMFADSLAAFLPPGAMVMGNNSKPRYASLHGKLYEAFPGSPGEGYLPGSLMDLDVWNSLAGELHITSVNGLYPYEEVGGSPDDMPPFRFRYTASLLADNYFSYDFSTFDHYQVTWYDLYDFELGRPLGQRYTIGETPHFLADFEAGLPAEVDPFEPMSDTRLTAEPGLVIQGMQSLLAETYPVDVWPTAFYLAIDGGWRPNETYTLSMRYRVLDTERDDARLFFKTSPGNVTTTIVNAEPGAEGLYRASFSIGDDTDTTVRMMTKGAVSVVVDSLAVVQGAGGLWARDYENGVVVCNASGFERNLPHNEDWILVDGDRQHEEHPGWLSGEEAVLGFEDGLVFAFADSETPAPDTPLPGAAIALGRPWPNPFNPRFSVILRGREGAAASLELFDLRGRRLAKLWEGRLGEDSERLSFDLDVVLPGGLPSGVYLLRASGAGDVRQRKLVLLR